MDQPSSAGAVSKVSSALRWKELNWKSAGSSEQFVSGCCFRSAFSAAKTLARVTEHEKWRQPRHGAVWNTSEPFPMSTQELPGTSLHWIIQLFVGPSWAMCWITFCGPPVERRANKPTT